MKQISFQAKMEALELYLKGLSANDIVAETGISKGAVVSILKDGREGKFPDLELKDRIDQLHRLSMRLKKEELDVPQAKLGFTFFERVQGLGIEPEKVEEWIEFCSEVSPSPPEGLIPAAMEVVRIQKETGKSCTEIASEVRELSSQREKLLAGVADLRVQEARVKELKSELGTSQEKVQRLRIEESDLQRKVDSLSGVLQRRAGELGISLDELETRLRELVSLENEVAARSKEKSKLEGEVEALTARQQKLASQMEKAASDFQRDIKLIRQANEEVTRIAETKGRYEEEIRQMEWAQTVLPFLSDPDKVRDTDFSLISIVVNCLDKWIATQPKFARSWDLRWYEVKTYVRSNKPEP